MRMRFVMLGIALALTPAVVTAPALAQSAQERENIRQKHDAERAQEGWDKMMRERDWHMKHDGDGIGQATKNWEREREEAVKNWRPPAADED